MGVGRFASSKTVSRVCKSGRLLSRGAFSFTSELFLNAWKEWLTYRSEIKKPYKTGLSERTALNNMVRENNTEGKCILCIEQSIANQWQGLFKYKEDEKRN